MTPKCLHCSSRLSLAWFTLSFNSTKHRCVSCGTLHSFTNKHKILELLFIIPLVFLTSFSQSIIPWDIIRFVFLVSIAVSLIIIIPGQHMLVPEDEVETKKTESSGSKNDA